MTRDDALHVLTGLIEEFDAAQDVQHRIGPVDPSVLLLGPGGRLDSLGTVNFLLLLEERMSAALARPLSLLDEDFLMSFADEGLTLSGLVDSVLDG